jgi:hypothetical protein
MMHIEFIKSNQAVAAWEIKGFIRAGDHLQLKFSHDLIAFLEKDQNFQSEDLRENTLATQMSAIDYDFFSIFEDQKQLYRFPAIE